MTGAVPVNTGSIVGAAADDGAAATSPASAPGTSGKTLPPAAAASLPTAPNSAAKPSPDATGVGGDTGVTPAIGGVEEGMNGNGQVSRGVADQVSKDRAGPS